MFYLAGLIATIMKSDMRQELARERFVEKIRKVGQLIRLAKTFPRRASKPQATAK